MGKTLAVLLEVITIVAGGGQAIAVDNNHALGHLPIIPRLFQSDAPWRAISLLAGRLELACRFGEVIVDAHRLKFCGNRIHRITGGDAVEIDLDGGVLAQLVAVDAQVFMADALAGFDVGFGGRDFFPAGLRTKSPEIEQRLHRQIVGAVALH
ncbi:hypothetical protein D3C85_1325770 [compost metagenome]